MNNITESSVPDSDGTKQKSPPISGKRFALILSSPLLLPMAIWPICVIAVLIGCGWLFVFIGFFVSVSAFMIAILGAVHAIANISTFSAFIYYLGIGLCGLSAVYPLFIIAKEFLKGFYCLQTDLLLRISIIKANILQKIKNKTEVKK